VVEQGVEVGIPQVLLGHEMDIGIDARQVLIHGSAHQHPLVSVAGYDHYGHAFTSFAVTGRIDGFNSALISVLTLTGCGLGLLFIFCHNVLIIKLFNAAKLSVNLRLQKDKK
jgi:hypothetical protein